MSTRPTAAGHAARAEFEEDENGSLVLNILTATAPFTGDEFFKRLTSTINSTTGMRVSFVAELLLELDKARCVAGHYNSQLIQPFEFSLHGTPAADTVARGQSAYSDSLIRRFPNSFGLPDMGAEAYVAVLLTASSGDQIGLLGVVHDAALHDAGGMLSLLRSVAPRVAAELERRQHENARHRSETRFRLLAESSKDVLFYYQLVPFPRFEYVSPAVEEIVGLPPEAFYANPDLATQLIHDEDRAQVMRAMASGDEGRILARLIRPDSQTRWIEYRNFPFRDLENRLIAVGGSIRDITPRVEAEENLRLSEQYRRALLEAMPDTVFRVNATGDVLDYVSPDSMRDLLKNDEPITGRNIIELLPAGNAALVRRLVPLALRSGGPHRLEFEIAGDHDSKFYEARCVPFGREEVLLIVRDFTAMKWHETEEERRRLRDEIDIKVEERIRTNPYGLTYRELAVLHLVADGSADKQIAEALGISIYTVNKHVGNILGKMNASSRTEAGVRALREGLLG